jgi:mono/diheme cytochrome c family protein
MRSKKSIVLAAVLLLFVAGAVALFLWFRNHGFSARAEPSWIEAKLARHARRIATPANAKEAQNPFPKTEASLTEAREHFVEHCSMCHGIDGRGQTVIGRNLYPKVPPMTDADTQQLTDGELFYIISNGVRFTGMPAWGGEDSPESIWGLVTFIRRLPKLSPEEIKLMQQIAAGADEHKTGEAGMEEMPGMKGMKDEKDTKDEGKAAGQNNQGKRKPAKPHPH